MDEPNTQAAPISPGVHDLPFSEYHALDAWGSGALKAMRRGPPVRVLWERENESRDTDATRLGSAVHCLLLMPELYESTYAIKPEGMSFASKEGKAWRDDPSRAGLTILSAEVGVTVACIVESLQCKAAVRDSLVKADREVSYLWECSISGERCKARPDWTQKSYGYDLKVSRHAGGHALALRAFYEGWFHQGAHYRTGAIELGMPIKGWRLVVVEPTLPHFVYTLEIKQNTLDLLELENIDTLKALHECRVSGIYPGTPESWIKVEAPPRALEGLEDVVLGEEPENEQEAF